MELPIEVKETMERLQATLPDGFCVGAAYGVVDIAEFDTPGWQSRWYLLVHTDETDVTAIPRTFEGFEVDVRPIPRAL